MIINDNPLDIDGIEQQPNLLLAQTIFHEFLHCLFYHQIMEAICVGSYVEDSEVIKNALLTSQYQTLANYFITTADYSHNYMAEKYRRAIARVTQQYATGIAVQDYEVPDPFYSNLAWQGLMHYDDIAAWQLLVGPDPANPSEASQAIMNSINDYISQHANETCP